MAKKKSPKNVGIPGIEAPSELCTDRFCPFHGEIGVRGRVFEGVITSTKPSRTAVVEWTRRIFVPKYERFEKKKSKVYAHIPSCLTIHTNDKVKIGECRPISKMKKFVVLTKVEDKK